MLSGRDCKPKRFPRRLMYIIHSQCYILLVFHVNNSGVTATKYKKKEAHEDWKRKHKEKMCYINTMSFFPKEKNQMLTEKELAGTQVRFCLQMCLYTCLQSISRSPQLGSESNEKNTTVFWGTFIFMHELKCSHGGGSLQNPSIFPTA